MPNAITPPRAFEGAKLWGEFDLPFHAPNSFERIRKEVKVRLEPINPKCGRTYMYLCCKIVGFGVDLFIRNKLVEEMNSDAFSELFAAHGGR